MNYFESYGNMSADELDAELEVLELQQKMCDNLVSVAKASTAQKVEAAYKAANVMDIFMNFLKLNAADLLASAAKEMAEAVQEEIEANEKSIAIAKRRFDIYQIEEERRPENNENMSPNAGLPNNPSSLDEAADLKRKASDLLHSAAEEMSKAPKKSLGNMTFDELLYAELDMIETLQKFNDNIESAVKGKRNAAYLLGLAADEMMKAAEEMIDANI